MRWFRGDLGRTFRLYWGYTWVYQGYIRGISGGIPGVHQGYIRGISGVYQGYIRGISGIYQGYIRGISPSLLSPCGGSMVSPSLLSPKRGLMVAQQPKRPKTNRGRRFRVSVLNPPAPATKATVKAPQKAWHLGSIGAPISGIRDWDIPLIP